MTAEQTNEVDATDATAETSEPTVEQAPENAPASDAEPTTAADAAPDAETEAVDPARQAEIDALAAELLGKAPAKKPVRRSRRVTVKDPNELDPAAAAETPAEEPEAEPEAPVKKPARARRGTKAAAAEAAAAEEAAAAAATEETPAESTPTADAEAPAQADETASDDAQTDATDGESDSDSGDSAEGSGRSRSRRGRSRSRNGNGSAAGGGDAAPASAESDDDRAAGRGRDRGRKRSGGRLGDDLEPEVLPDDVLLPIAGILDVLDNYAFVRTTGYLAGVTDVYVSLGQVKKYGLRKGDAVVGSIRQPRDGEQPGRQKYNALVKVDSVNGQAPDASGARTEFDALVPVQPSVTLAGETHKGQRALTLGGAGTGKTKSIADLAAAVSAAQPEAHLMVMLIGPRPEEVTDFRRAVKGEVIVAGLELAADDHVTVVELAVERAKRLVELGIDVVVLIDSITNLGRAYASLVPGARSLLEDPSIALPAQRLLGAARATEDGASLTIVATASAEHPLDALVATELSSVANQVTRL